MLEEVQPTHDPSQLEQTFPAAPKVLLGQLARQVLPERYICSPEESDSPQESHVVLVPEQVRQLELHKRQTYVDVFANWPAGQEAEHVLSP